MVTIYTGPEKQPWLLYDEVLCFYSDYFKKAFRGNFKEATDRCMSLEDEDTEVFGYFVNWLYTGTVDCGLPEGSTHEHEDPDHFIHWCRLDVFADKYGLEDLATVALEEWQNCYGTKRSPGPSGKEIQFIYENCPEKSKFRSSVVRLVLARYLQWGFEDFAYMAEVSSSHPSFAENFARELKFHAEIRTWVSCHIPNCSMHMNNPNPVPAKNDRKRQRVWGS